MNRRGGPASARPGGTYHELRLSLEVLEITTDPAERLKWVDAIDAAAGRIAALTERIEALWS